MRRIFTTQSASQTRELAVQFARLVGPGQVIALEGTLGAGKTCWIQGLATGLEVPVPVISPTYTLAIPYNGRVRLIHVDAYRISSPDEILDLALEEEIEDGSVIAIEWYDRFPGSFPKADWIVRLTEPGIDRRRIEMEAESTSLGQSLAGLAGI